MGPRCGGPERPGFHRREPMTGVHFDQWTLGTAIASPSLAMTSLKRPDATSM